jgi:hypothetical protein
MSLKNAKLNNVQLVNRDTKMCLGTPSLSNPTPGTVSCNESDKTQRWDISEIYGQHGILKKTHQTGELQNVGDGMVILNAKQTDNLDDIIGYDIISNLGSLEFNDKTVKLDRHGNLKIPYNPSIGTFGSGGWVDSDFQMTGGCINSMPDNTLSFKRNHPRPYTVDNGQWDGLQCDSKWDILVDCDGPQMPNTTCNRTTGKYECNPGHYGKTCDFIDTNSKDQADAFDRFYSNCLSGLSSTMSTKDNCINYHKTQAWLPTTDITDPEFVFWDVKNSDDYRHNAYLLNNNVQLAKADTANSIYNAKKQATDVALMSLSNDKDRIAADQKLRMVDRKNAYNDAEDQRNVLKTQLSMYTLPTDIKDVLDAQKANAIQKAGETAKLTSFTNQIKNLESQLSELQNKDRITSISINNLKMAISKL